MGWSGKFNQLDNYRFEIPKSYQSHEMRRLGVAMRVPAMIYSDANLIDKVIGDDSPDQVANVATLPGIVGKSIAMPDIHHGYGFAIGGVAAFDATEGIISPGGVGYDINCGVRLLRSSLTYEDIKPYISKIIDTIFKTVPCGVGSEGKIRLSNQETDAVLTDGAGSAVRNGYGWDDDLICTEESGAIKGADASLISSTAKKRGNSQLGTLGAGNHFLEIQRVDEIYDNKIAGVYGITAKGQICVMIHTGSRGLGHQVCTDYLEVMRVANKKYGIPLIDRELACAPAGSEEGEEYFAAMNAGANFAWANRQVIAHWIRESFTQVLGQSARSLGMSQIYDIAHNMAKLEQHEINGKKRWLFVHRKGATRAFGPGHADIPDKYQAVGQPVLIPGDMGTASYLLAGTEQAMKETFGSSCHGAGRNMSRHAAKKAHPAEVVFQQMKEANIYLQAKSHRVVAEEAPGAYKNIDSVVEITHNSGIAKKIVRLTPLGVYKAVPFFYPDHVPIDC